MADQGALNRGLPAQIALYTSGNRAPSEAGAGWAGGWAGRRAAGGLAPPALVADVRRPAAAAHRRAPVLAAAGAVLFGWFAVRLSGVYLAMLTLAFAQIVWAIVYQWEPVTGGSNGVLGIWPTPPFDTRRR